MFLPYCVLGGDSPGAYQNLPSTPTGETVRYPIFPLVVVCKDSDEAQSLLSNQAFALPRNLSGTDLDIATNVVRILQQTEAPEGPFYPVVMGLRPAIYRDWKSISRILATNNRRYRKTTSLKDAVAYMLTKGGYETASDLLSNALPPTSSLGCATQSAGSSPTESPNNPSAELITAFRMNNLMAAIDTPCAKSGVSYMPLDTTAQEEDPPNQPWIFQHIRSLKGVVKTNTKPTSLNSGFPPDINDALKDYLFSHGYESSAVKEIFNASVASPTVIDFLGYLCPKGLPVKEAEYMWRLMINCQ